MFYELPFEIPDEFLMEPVHIAIPASEHDPRNPPDLPPWIVPHYVPELHPDDVDEVDGIRCTSVARTLIDCATDCTEIELWEMFFRARERGMLDPEQLRGARERVEWRPSLAMFDRVAAEFA